MKDREVTFRSAEDLTSKGQGVHPDADALVAHHPRILRSVPGTWWTGMVGSARAVLRLPAAEMWNGKLVIGATPAVRSEFSLDLILSDIVLQQGYAFAACDKGTPGVVLRDPNRQITEWPENYRKLTEFAVEAVRVTYARPAERVYISGLSNGGYITRIMLERFPDLFDGGVEWEGVLWHPAERHLLTDLPVYIEEYPVYANWRGDATQSERQRALERLIAAGLHPESEPYWPEYFANYWVVTLWLYGHNLDPDWKPFAAEWDPSWLKDPSPLVYPWRERADAWTPRIQAIANSGGLTKPLLSVAGNWDCLIPFRHHAQAYARLVESAGSGQRHRLYEIDRGNHVDGLLRSRRGRQQAVHPYYEAAFHYLEAWVERGTLPPASGRFETINEFAPDMELLSMPT